MSQESLAPGGMPRRKLLATTAVLAASTTVDHLWGRTKALGMNDDPEVEVCGNPYTDQIILVAGGLANDGIILGHLMRDALGPLRTILALRYAETNMAPKPMERAITHALGQYSLNGTIDTYFNSAAGILLMPTIKALHAAGRQFGTLILDCNPSSKADVKGIQGMAVKGHLDAARHSRILNWANHFATDSVMPPADDKDPAASLRLAEAHRQAIVAADTITTGPQAKAIRDFAMPPGAMVGVAQRVVYLHSPDDPLINPDTAARGWRRIFGHVEQIVDPHRPYKSHAAGCTYPKGVMKVLRGEL